MRAAKEANPEAIFIFVPGGAQSPAIAKALADRGIDPRKTKVMSQMELTDEQALKNMGDTALGIITSGHYDHNLGSQVNRDFVAAFNGIAKRNPDFFAVGGYDGMHLIYEALKKTGGNTDGEALVAAAKGMAWESPRGPMSIDPATRDVVQTVYMRRVEKVGDQLLNVEFDRIENVRDPVKARMSN
jgi:branched-chain amino acid transport system substrate-binding protein